MEDFERELRQALERRPAPPSLKRKLMERRSRQRAERWRGHVLLWQRLAAGAVLAAVLAGAMVWRHAEQQRKGEAVREQVFTALRITGHALDQMRAQLEAHDQDAQE